MPIIGPATALASSGSAEPIAATEPSAIGSTRTFQTSAVPTIHSARLQAADEVTPEGNAVVSSSQWSASRTASATASRWRAVTDGSLDWATVLRARSSATSQLMGPSCGCSSDWIWLKIAPRSGIPGIWPPRRPAGLTRAEAEPEAARAARPSRPAPEELLEGRALEGVLVPSSGSSGVLPGLSFMAPRYAEAATPLSTGTGTG